MQNAKCPRHKTKRFTTWHLIKTSIPHYWPNFAISLALSHSLCWISFLLHYSLVFHRVILKQTSFLEQIHHRRIARLSNFQFKTKESIMEDWTNPFERENENSLCYRFTIFATSETSFSCPRNRIVFFFILTWSLYFPEANNFQFGLFDMIISLDYPVVS